MSFIDPVVPALADAGESDVEPLAVKDGSVRVGVKTIPGLEYGLRRGKSAADAHAGEVVAHERYEQQLPHLTPEQSVDFDLHCFM